MATIFVFTIPKSSKTQSYQDSSSRMKPTPPSYVSSLWGFKSLNLTGPFSGGYYHELFRRERPILCRGITRIVISGEGRSRAGNARKELRIKRKEDDVNTDVNPEVTHVLPKRQTSSCLPASSTNVDFSRNTPRKKNTRSALNLEVFNAIPNRRLQISSRPREHGNRRSLRDGAKSQFFAKTFRMRMSSFAIENSNSRIARQGSRNEESSKSPVGREEGRTVQNRSSRSASALTRSCASVDDDKISTTSRPRCRKQECSRSLGGRVKSQPSTDAFRRRRSRSAGAFTISFASVADGESSMTPIPRFRK